jgi:signal transduction histidine kinase/CheY-like chemotaxis protein
MFREVDESGSALARMAAANSQYAVYASDSRALESIAEGMAASQAVEYLRFVDRSGAVLFEQVFEQGENPAPFVPVGPDELRRRDFFRDGGFIDFTVAVLRPSADEDPVAASGGSSEPLGYVQIGICTDRLRRRLTGLGFAMFSVAGIVALGAAFAARWMARRLVAPLADLAEATRHVAEGRLDLAVETPSHDDEVAELASSFRTMVATLKENRVEIEDYQRGLERKVAERTAALEEARARAEDASRVKSRFLATMSHELRTPIHGVLGGASMLESAGVNDEQRAHLGTIRTSAEAMLVVVNDVLDFSKIEAGKLELERLPFDLRRCVREACAVVAPQAEAKGLRLGVTVADGVPAWLSGDPHRVRQILLNLLGNAVKFTARGGVDVGVAIDGEDGAVLIDVHDTGIGIPEEARGRLFQPFTQADSSTTRRFGGTGLGLAIVRQLVLAMGGTIEVTSAPEAGTRFSLRLPLVASDPPAEAEAPSACASVAGLTVLLAEDNPINRKIGTSMLEKLGVRVDLANDGEAAVAAFRERGYDAILMDCMMPGLDGFGATRAIREIEARRDDGERIPIVAVTAAAFSDERRRCEEAGMDGFLAKPFKPGELAAALARWARKPAGV